MLTSIIHRAIDTLDLRAKLYRMTRERDEARSGLRRRIEDEVATVTEHARKLKSVQRDRDLCANKADHAAKRWAEAKARIAELETERDGAQTELREAERWRTAERATRKLLADKLAEAKARIAELEAEADAHEAEMQNAQEALGTVWLSQTFNDTTLAEAIGLKVKACRDLQREVTDAKNTLYVDLDMYHVPMPSLGDLAEKALGRMTAAEARIAELETALAEATRETEVVRNQRNLATDAAEMGTWVWYGDEDIDSLADNALVTLTAAQLRGMLANPAPPTTDPIDRGPELGDVDPVPWSADTDSASIRDANGRHISIYASNAAIAHRVNNWHALCDRVERAEADRGLSDAAVADALAQTELLRAKLAAMTSDRDHWLSLWEDPSLCATCGQTQDSCAQSWSAPDGGGCSGKWPGVEREQAWMRRAKAAETERDVLLRVIYSAWDKLTEFGHERAGSLSVAIENALRQEAETIGSLEYDRDWCADRARLWKRLAKHIRDSYPVVEIRNLERKLTEARRDRDIIHDSYTTLEAELRTLRDGGQGALVVAVAWRWRWRHAHGEPVWNLQQEKPDVDGGRFVIEPLYTAPPTNPALERVIEAAREVGSDTERLLSVLASAGGATRLSNAVQLGQVSWAVKCSDAVEAATASVSTLLDALNESEAGK